MSDSNTFSINHAVANGAHDGMHPHMVSFTSNLGNLNPEVAKKALDQAPELGKTAREATTSAKDVIIRGFQSVDQSAGHMYGICDKNSEALRNCLNNENTSDEVKLKAIDAIVETNKTVTEEHNKVMQFAEEESTKQWIGGLIVTGLLGALVGVGISALTGLPIKTK